jgi:hypothetical protein
MLDILGSLFLGAYLASLAIVLAGMIPLPASFRFALLLAGTAWTILIIAQAASGSLAAGALGKVPPGVVPFAVAVTSLAGLWLLHRPLREAMVALPLPTLVALHGFRVGGLLFLLLYADGRLSAPFGPVAALGDMITGIGALSVAAMYWFGRTPSLGWLKTWNAFGALDLVVAIALGLLSAPGTTFRVFEQVPGLQVMASVPWVLVPSVIVPLLFFVHVAIASKLVPRSVPTRTAPVQR